MKKILLNTRILVVFFTLFMSIPYFYGKSNEKTGIENVFDWAILDAKIMSWEGQQKSALVKTWGNPSNFLELGDGEEQYEYSIFEVDSGNIVSSRISFFIKGKMIESVSYDGDYSQLVKICKKESDLKKLTNIYIKYNNIRKINLHPKWFEISTKDLFEAMLSINIQKKSIDLSLYNGFKNSAKEAFSSLSINNIQKAKEEVSICENFLLKAKDTDDINSLYSHLACFLAYVKIYREIFEKENYESNLEKELIQEESEQQKTEERQLKIEKKLETARKSSKYTLEDFASKKIKWNEVSLKDIKNLKGFASPTEVDFMQNNYDYRKDILKFAENFKTEEDYIEPINSILDTGLNESTVYIWIMWIEYYYEVFPNKLK